MTTREATERRLVLQHRPVVSTLLSAIGVVAMAALLVRVWGMGVLTREGEVIVPAVTALLAYLTFRSGRITTVVVDLDRTELVWRQVGLNGIREERFALDAIDAVIVTERRGTGRRSANVRYRAEMVFTPDHERDAFPFIRDHLPSGGAFTAAQSINAMLERHRGG